jgi:hypothetical protein
VGNLRLILGYLGLNLSEREYGRSDVLGVVERTNTAQQDHSVHDILLEWGKTLLRITTSHIACNIFLPWPDIEPGIPAGRQ